MKNGLSVERAKLLREASRLYWMVKGHIPPFLREAPPEELSAIIDSYTRRLWNNNEAYLHEEGFEESWRQYNDGFKSHRDVSPE